MLIKHLKNVKCVQQNIDHVLKNVNLIFEKMLINHLKMLNV